MRRFGSVSLPLYMAGGRGRRPIGPAFEKSDNAVVILPKAFYHEREFAEEVKKVEQKLQETGNVIRVRHELNYDSTGDPAVYFRVLMTDAALETNILEATQGVSWIIEENLDLREYWGVYPYFRFRSASEQEAMQEPSWA